MGLSTSSRFIQDSSSAGSSLAQISGLTNNVTIANGVATSLFTVLIGTTAHIGGAFFYTIRCDDGTDYQSMTGMVTYAACSKAGTQTLTITTAAANDSKAVSAGTLTVAFTFVAGTGLGTVKVQPTTSLTATTFTIMLHLMPMPGIVTVVG